MPVERIANEPRLNGLDLFMKSFLPPGPRIVCSKPVEFCQKKEGLIKDSVTLGHLDNVKQPAGSVERTVKKPIPIDYNTYRAVKNFSSRVRFIVMHYTAANFQKSVELLTHGQVSAHYLVPDPADRSYSESGDRDMTIFNLVDEKERAWHAGVSSWRDRNNLNDTSIGIEIVNESSDDGQGNFTFPPFHPEQISAVKELTTNIIQRYPDIRPINIVGHSDIAPGRKLDPGPAFPWQQLYQEGIGAWYDEDTKAKYLSSFSLSMPTNNDIISKLKAYGYNVMDCNSDSGFKALIRAFQLHFRPDNYDGKVDVETAAILYALVEKYV